MGSLDEGNMCNVVLTCLSLASIIEPTPGPWVYAAGHGYMYPAIRFWEHDSESYDAH